MCDFKPNKILIVDDEAANIDYLCRILMPLYDIVVAKNGKSAIERAKKHRPGLILLDVIMPDMSGFDVIVSLKESDHTRRIPVIFITGLNSSENEEKGLLLGAVDYITKPFNDSIVKARVGTHLQIVEYINTIERLCRVDTLTNIANRRYFDDQVTMEWDRAVRDGNPLGLLIIDVDHFKKFNDVYGHPQGDVLLKTVVGVFEGALFRPGDFVARWGGEEFVMLLPDTDLEGALEVAERVRARVEETVFPCGDGNVTSVTVSIGVNSEVPLSSGSIEEFVAKADKALYDAKGRGRNRVAHSANMS